MTTSPPQPPQGPYAGQPGGYGPPPQQQFPQYTQQPDQQAQPPQYGGQPYQQEPYQQQAPQQDQGQYPPPYQGQYAQQDQHSQQQYPQFPQQGQQPGFAPQGQLTCRFCGGYPAVDATVRGHQGLVILMRFLKLRGPFCKTCGTASVRDMTSKSLWQGWWGIGSSIINPITMLTNIGPSQKFKNLPEPTPGQGRPMDPGKPLFQRPAIFGLLIPIAVIALIVIANLNSTESKAQVGACVVNKGTSGNPNVKVVDCTSTEAEYRIVGKIDDSTDDSKCDQFAGAEASYVYESGSTKYTLCLAPK
ncbi:toxin-antitoxin system, toxin component [Kribbella sp. NPDC026611]|uniref:LppU/SCO3897 family protein n=1 Tax=Kribbella sp. NPDC026611 TaxID=3154911 RepID=UPI0033D02E1E